MCTSVPIARATYHAKQRKYAASGPLRPSHAARPYRQTVTSGILPGLGAHLVIILRVRCRNLREFEAHLLPDLPNGGAFCPTTTELQPGTPVVVEFACDALPN